jgi:hypothetical protein
MPSLAVAVHANTDLTDTYSGSFALINDYELVYNSIGVDVDKSIHHAVAVDRQSEKVLDQGCHRTRPDYAPTSRP